LAVMSANDGGSELLPCTDPGTPFVSRNSLM
jgi:hypothetical protein